MNIEFWRRQPMTVEIIKIPLIRDYGYSVLTSFVFKIHKELMNYLVFNRHLVVPGAEYLKKVGGRLRLEGLAVFFGKIDEMSLLLTIIKWNTLLQAQMKTIITE